MRRKEARLLAERLSNQELQKMLDRAKLEVQDWEVVSNVNKGMSKGAAWNVLAKGFNKDSDMHVIAKTNMIREFGQYLFREKDKTVKKKENKIFHQDPIFK